MIDVDVEGTRVRRTTWLVGGILLVVAAVLWFGIPLGPQPLSGWVALTVQAAAFVVFAVGLGCGGSVTARRPLGTAALVALGLWVIAGPAVRLLMTALPVGTGPDAAERFAMTHLIVSITIDVIGLALALIASVQILRAGVVASPWRWMPLAALAVIVAGRVLLFISTPLPLDAALAARSLAELAIPVVLLLLGAAAIVLSVLTPQRVPEVVGRA
ncbi:hypothetical protein [Microbacterium sp. YJN-G]|uniref:hypothetical protein n=1 Tax=Microbacterium sp. YJN-G TaxID=2763257 RepID=UPI001878A2C5|nr:hypothetical protein [Microbacterium sp. YJN-G]